MTALRRKARTTQQRRAVRRKHRVAVLAFDGVVLGDLSVPVEIFGQRQGPAATHYEVLVCGPAATVATEYVRLCPPRRLRSLRDVDSVIVPGIRDLNTPAPVEIVRAVQAAARRGVRIASICTGAFVLAAAGILDGRRATTHWAAASALAERYPNVQVDPDVLYVDGGNVLTSAGAAAGLDLCLHLVRRDCGAAVAADVARLAVMPLERAGGQAQFIAHAPPAPSGESLGLLLAWIQEHLAEPLTLERIARRAGMSPRTLGRRFREQTGISPARWLAHARVRRAQQLLESGREPLESVAAAVGFASAITLRQRFGAVVGSSPSAYRRAFQSRDGPPQSGGREG